VCLSTGAELFLLRQQQFFNPIRSAFQPPDTTAGSPREFYFKINKIIFENQINQIHDVPKDRDSIICAQNNNV